MSKILYLMRHGQTMFNLRGKVQGASDSPLTELGISQAKQAGHYFKHNHITFDEAYSSSSERACDTLENVLPEQAYQRNKGLKEWSFGLFEGIVFNYWMQFGINTTFLELDYALSEEKRNMKLNIVSLRH